VTLREAACRLVAMLLEQGRPTALAEQLREVGDIERILARVALARRGRATSRSCATARRAARR
jgi:hypothetical protein